MSSNPNPKRVAILGGGISALTTAWHLTSSADLRARFDVTVYQMGWRLGGKLASGRDPQHGMRNQEHGLHVWFGWYENAFALFQALMKEWHASGLAPADCPIQTWQDAFSPCNYTPLGQTIDGQLALWKFHWGGNADVPGDGKVLMDPKGVITGIIGWCEALILDAIVRPGSPAPQPTKLAEGAVARAAGLVGDALHDAQVDVMHKAAHKAISLLREQLERMDADHRNWGKLQLEALRVSLAAAHAAVVPMLQNRREPADNVDAHLVRNAVDSALAIVRGMLNPAYQLPQNDFDLDLLDDMELRAFLKANGANPLVVDNWTCLKSLYDTMFEYPGGRLQGGNYAAGTALRIVIRMVLTYKGAALYLLNTGMGDILIAPLYEVLVARGVKFKFFHKVEEIGLSADGQLVDSVVLAEQARTLQGDYKPLFRVQNLHCWPATPFWDQLVDGEAMRAADVDLESHWTDWPTLGRVVLRRGVDFDEVVNGMALGAYKQLGEQPDPGAELRKKVPAIRAMAEALPLIPSGGIQLWCDKTADGMGFGPGRAAAVSWAWPMDVWADMTPTLATESWGLDGPASVHYWCGVLDTELFREPPASTQVPKLARDLLRDQLRKQMDQHAGVIWPASQTPSGFDWQLLHADPAAEGVERLEQQWIRANVDPTECCVGSPARTTRLRLRADRTGVQNLKIVGECAYTGLNTTCVESVIMAGMQAARALTGESLTVVGETFLSRGWLPGR